VVEPII